MVRYHADTEGEDGSATEVSEDEVISDSEVESEDLENLRAGKLAAIAVTNDAFTPRFARCENCKQEFDVSENVRGDCVWHPGMLSSF